MACPPFYLTANPIYNNEHLTFAPGKTSREAQRGASSSLEVSNFSIEKTTHACY